MVEVKDGFTCEYCDDKKVVYKLRKPEAPEISFEPVPCPACVDEDA